VPASSLFGDLTWKDAPTGLFAGVEVLVRSKVYVEDSNSQKAAPGYTVTSLRAGAEQRSGGWKTKEFVRLDNLFDRQYIGSVIVGDGNNRFYEPAPGRSWLLGASAQYSF
jgi:iron complex outermembrane receptor protein